MIKMRRLFSLVLAIALLSGLCACGRNGSGGTTGNAAANQEPEMTEPTLIDEETGPVPSAAVPIIEANYPILETLTEFSDGRAWVSYRDDFTLYYGVIDENGFLIYSVSHESLDNWGDYIIATPFQDDISCLYAGYDTDTLVGGRWHTGMIVVDRAGRELFNSMEVSAEYKYYYMGYGDGTILVIENIADFSSNHAYISELNLQGEVISRNELTEDLAGLFRADSSSGQNVDILVIWANYSYFGEDIFIGGIGKDFLHGMNYAVYNRKTHTLFRTDNSKFAAGLVLLTPFNSGYLESKYALGITPSKTPWEPISPVYMVSLDYLSDQKTWNTIDRDSIFIGSFSRDCIAEGLINDATGIYNYKGDLLAAYPENWDITSVTAFCNGYAEVYLKGADGNSYVTVVDTNGITQFDPVKETEAGARVHNYINEEVTIQRDNNFYQKPDGTIIDNIFIVSNLDEIAGQTFTNYSPEEDSVPAQTKQYVTSSDFAIEGKWKNIGQYTFGQVSSGAIVAFDGTHCNVVSPQDTYAIYKDGDNYRLDCTTLLGQTLSFTVKTVNKDNIDIYNGSSCLEMTRVD